MQECFKWLPAYLILFAGRLTAKIFINTQTLASQCLWDYKSKVKTWKNRRRTLATGVRTLTILRRRRDRTDASSAMAEWFVLSSIQPGFHSKLPAGADLAVAAFLIAFGVTSLLGNGTVLFVYFKKRKKLRPQEVMTVNLAVCDFGFSLLGAPFAIVSSLCHAWVFGDAGCSWYGMQGFVFGIGSPLTTCLISLDRCLKICCLRYGQLLPSAPPDPRRPQQEKALWASCRNSGFMIWMKGLNMQWDLASRTRIRPAIGGMGGTDGRRGSFVSGAAPRWPGAELQGGLWSQFWVQLNSEGTPRTREPQKTPHPNAQPAGQWIERRHMFLYIGLVWLYTVFWASLPTLGFGSYGPEPHGTSCTVNWWRIRSSLSDRIYIFLILTLCFGVPAITIITSYTTILLMVYRSTRALASIPFCSVIHTSSKDLRLTKYSVDRRRHFS
ncbi:hypothetical protein CRUP_027838 [Coryphaenoides rupestris]|nr:hypothetical protein CRUP_027838 [Coryphaenoides rupestris]